MNKLLPSPPPPFPPAQKPVIPQNLVFGQKKSDPVFPFRTPAKVRKEQSISFENNASNKGLSNRILRSQQKGEIYQKKVLFAPQEHLNLHLTFKSNTLHSGARGGFNFLNARPPHPSTLDPSLQRTRKTPKSTSKAPEVSKSNRLSKHSFKLRGNYPRNKGRSVSISEQSRFKKSLCPLRLSKRVDFGEIIRSELCLKNLVRFQTKKYSQMQKYFGVLQIKRLLNDDHQNLLSSRMDSAIVNDIFPMMCQSEGTYSEFSSSSLEEGESRAKMKYFQTIEGLCKMKAIREEERGRDRTKQDHDLYSQLFGQFGLNGKASEKVPKKRKNMAKSQVRKKKPADYLKKPQLKKAFTQEHDPKQHASGFKKMIKCNTETLNNEKNVQFFESFGKSFFQKKSIKEEEQTTVKKREIPKSETRKKNKRKPNKSVHLFKFKDSNRNPELKAKSQKEISFYSNEKKSRRLFRNFGEPSRPLLQSKKAQNIIYLSNDGIPSVYSSLKPTNNNFILHTKSNQNLADLRLYSNKKVEMKVINQGIMQMAQGFGKMDVGIGVKLYQQKNMNLLYSSENKPENSQYQKLRAQEPSHSESNSKPSRIQSKKSSLKTTSNFKIKSGTSNLEPFSGSLNSTQDFLKCESSIPSLVSNPKNLESINSFKKEAHKPNEARLVKMSPIKDTEGSEYLKDSYFENSENYSQNNISKRHLERSMKKRSLKKELKKSKGNTSKEYLSTKKKKEENNIFESIFSFKNEKIKNFNENSNRNICKANKKFDFEIQNNINVYIGSKKREKTPNVNSKQNSYERYIHRRKTSRQEIKKLGKLIEKQRKYIKSKSISKNFKNTKENYEEGKQKSGEQLRGDKIVQFQENKQMPKGQLAKKKLLNNYTISDASNVKTANLLKFGAARSQFTETFLTKKSYNTLVKSENNKQTKCGKYTKRKKIQIQREPSNPNQILRSKDHFLLSSDYNLINSNFVSQNLNNKYSSKKKRMLSPFLIQNSSNKAKAAELQTRKSSFDFNLKPKPSQQDQVLQNKFLKIEKNKSEVFAKNCRRFKTPHQFNRKKLKNTRNNKSKENRSFDKGYFSNMAKHPILLVPESMVTSHDNACLVQKVRHKNTRKKNYSLFQKKF